jgi:zinc protease
MSPAKVDGQRDVVKNERRQGVENQPYGKVEDVLPGLLYPKGHPYSWRTFGSMADLSAASYEDVVDFFKTYYVPGNASLVVAGDIDPAKTRALVEKWFSDVKPASPVPPQARPGVALEGVTRKTITDRVQLPRLYLAWLTPAQYEPGDAALDVVSEILAGGKNSRLYKRLVYDLQIAQDVEAAQVSAALGSYFMVVVTPRRPQGSDATASDEALVDKVKAIVDEEIDRLRNEPPTQREVQRALNQLEASFYNSLENLQGKASRLNAYLVDATNPDWFNEDLSRYRSLDPTDIQAAVRMHLPADRRVELTVLPEK